MISVFKRLKKFFNYHAGSPTGSAGTYPVLVLTLFLGLVLRPVCGPDLNAAEGVANKTDEVVDRIVAIVNDDIILLSDIEKWLKPYKAQIQERNLPARTRKEMLYKAREEVIEERIDERLTAQRASALGIRVSDDEVDEALERIKRNMHYTDEQFRSSLREAGLSMEAYREQLESRIRRSKVLSQEVTSKIVVTDEDVRKYYDEHSDRLASGEPRYHLRNIIMQPSGREEKEALREEMNRIHRQLLDGASFEAMARQHSQSSFAERGGDLGRFELDDLSPQIRAAVENMEPGEISPVLDTGVGLQLFYLEDIISDSGETADAVPEKVRQAIYDEKMEIKFDEWVTSLRKDSYIKIIR